MPIQVSCPNCSTSFSVNDKFAGKTGPCPKCKTPITIPGAPVSAAASAPKPEVKIHAPDPADAPAAGGKAPKRAQYGKPIAREDSSLSTMQWLLLAATFGGLAAAAKFLGEMARMDAEGVVSTSAWAVRGGALFIAAIPTSLFGYSILRDDELQPYRGRGLFLRTLICCSAYTALWGAFAYIPAELYRSIVNWFVIAPPFLMIGAGIAFACYDFDFGTGFFHYSLYVLVSLGLGWLAGLKMPWALATGS